ncbi:nucleotidyltransferase family protein [Alicyclobacillus fastidiosus]|uniref:Nucleotidyltransferase family protein n=1 Tax=Alicyclobacillus fastidiosus TaxID=392011 RepID=A0ABY6ZAA1_9BACL|nr:nucleotidyltransferase family protein [Alicyclobacillus fastidiosus]WAH39767.1 nucleotidyltransferase family protein [Alicyclobacillus fastidiosus]GMA61009.1 alcohol dehydrogenase [Alicyclobacillus fastidiosus]
MKPCTKIMVHPDSSIEETIRVIDNHGFQIALVVDSERHLLGTVTDGDIRRAILNGVDLHRAIRVIMNTRPTVVQSGTSPQSVFALMGQKRVRGIPVIDDKGRVVGIELLEDFLQTAKRPNNVVLMAGGLGTRLAPLTANCPKPLLSIGPKPILEIILTSLINHSFHRFYFSVNYKAEMIKDYFGRGEKWGVEIEYLWENKRLGTAGALSLLPPNIMEPVIVINGDLLTRVDFGQLLEFHTASQSVATMGIREHVYSIPYGVVQFADNRLIEIHEKPQHRLFVNAGIYVIEPQVLSLIPPCTNIDMTDFLEQLAQKNLPVSVFPIREYWLDIGKMDDYHRALREYPEVFP